MEKKKDNISLPSEITATGSTSALTELTKEQQLLVSDFAKKIDISSPTQVLGYGVEARKKLDGYTNGVLSEVKNKDLGNTGELITSVILKLKDCQLDEPKGIKGLFGRGKNYVRTLKTRYESANTSIESIVSELNNRQSSLQKDIEMLENLYDQAEEYYVELTMYIAAGEEAIELAKSKARELYTRAQETGSQMDAQKYNNFMNQIGRFEQKIHDLKLTKSATLQLAPQIRMLQQNSSTLAEKLQSTVFTTIPLWKQQLVVSLGIENALEAAQLQKMVTDTTNELLRTNAERLHQVSVQTATELERGVIDIETLKKVNQELIATLDDVVKIQKDGIAARKLAETEIIALEGELKTKLLTSAREEYVLLPVDETVELPSSKESVIPVVEDVVVESPTTEETGPTFKLKL